MFIILFLCWESFSLIHLKQRCVLKISELLFIVLVNLIIMRFHSREKVKLLLCQILGHSGDLGLSIINRSLSSLHDGRLISPIDSSYGTLIRKSSGHPTIDLLLTFLP